MNNMIKKMTTKIVRENFLHTNIETTLSPIPIMEDGVKITM